MKENDRKMKKNEEKWKIEKKRKNEKKMKKKGKDEKKMKKWKKWKNEKNEKKNEKKMVKNERKMKKWIHTQNPRRFPGFTVVVVTFFVKIIDDFHDFVSECVSFPRKINNPFGW